MVMLFVHLRGLDIYGWITLIQISLHSLHSLSYFMGPVISRFFDFYLFFVVWMGNCSFCMQHLLNFSFKFWPWKVVKTWENGKFWGKSQYFGNFWVFLLFSRWDLYMCLHLKWNHNLTKDRFVMSVHQHV